MQSTFDITPNKIGFFYLCTTPIMIFLGYIDERYLNFKFLTDPTFWICVMMYGGFALIFQVAGYKLMYYKVKPFLRTLLSGLIPYKILFVFIILKIVFQILGNIAF